MSKRPEIIISGVSGRFSNCANVDQLRDNLYNGIDMCYENEERWPKGIYGLPSRSGALRDLQNFDAAFFGLTDEEADLIDPSTRINIDTTFEALCDAGLNPWNLGHKRVALFQGQTHNEMNRFSTANDKRNFPSPQFQERLIAYIFDINNGVYSYETACSSGFSALNEAFTQLTHGYIDLAIVSCANIIWTPSIALSYHKLGLTSPEGRCNFLDASASGYGRSETVSTLILERASDAQRIHGQLVFSMVNCDGYKPQGITYPSWQSQASLMMKCYKESQLDPKSFEYFECHGTGTEVGDMVEIKAIWSGMGDDVRSKLPLLLGSIKTNLGHSEAGSGLSSLIKCLLIFKSNSIPPNLHYEKPSPHIAEIEKGFVAPVLKTTPFHGQYIPINNFGFGGANCHVTVGRPLIQSNQNHNLSKEEESILILCCGRTHLSLETMVNGIMALKDEQITHHFVNLVNRYSYFMSSVDSPKKKMNHRCYIIRSSDKLLKLSPTNGLTSSETRVPICFAFPGAGCQLDKMIQPFMNLKPFQESIEGSLRLIDPDGSENIRAMLFDARQSHWKLFAVGIFQIAVVDTLKLIGIEPDIIVGHSFGEYCCAYADGVLTKAETLDICYNLIKVLQSIINESGTFKSCSMISVALTWDELSPLIPNNLYPACFNAQDNVTLAGSTEDVVSFSNHLKTQNIFHRIIDSCGFGFHTQALGKFTELLRQKLTHYSKINRKSSSRWIISHDSTMNRHEPLNIQSLAVEIISKVVQFEKACKEIPKNAVCIEIAPRKFLTSLLKCNLTESLIVEVPFKVPQNHHRLHNSSEKIDQQYYPQFPEDLLSSLGTLYINGCLMNLEPMIRHQLNGSPAPVATPFLSPLIKLDHSIPRLVRSFPEYFSSNSSSQERISFDIAETGKQHLGFFHYNGYQAIPIGALINSLWSAFASLTAHTCDDLAVCLNRIKLHRLLLIDDSKSSSSLVSFLIKFLPTNQGKVKFTITTYSDNLLIMTGTVRILDDSSDEKDNENEISDNTSESFSAITVESNIFYGILSRHGLHYQGDLRNIIKVNGAMSSGVMRNHQDWVVRFESLLQFVSFVNNLPLTWPTAIDCKTNNIPIRFDEIHCIPGQLSSSAEPFVPVNYDKFLDTIKSESIYVKGINFGSFQSQLPSKLSPVEMAVETFIPRFNPTICRPLKECIIIIVDHLIDFTNQKSSSSSSTITLVTTANTSNSNNTKNDYEGQSMGEMVAHEFNERKLSSSSLLSSGSSPFNWIKINSLNQLLTTNQNNNSRNQLQDNKPAIESDPLTSSSNNRLLILETDNNTINLIDLITSPIILSTERLFDFLIVQQSSANEENYNLNETIKLLEPSGLVIVFNCLTDKGYVYLIRWSTDPIEIDNVTQANPSSFQLPPISSSFKLSNSDKLHCLLVNNLFSSSGLINRYPISSGGERKQQKLQLKWLINETINDDGNDSKIRFNEYLPIGLTCTVLSEGIQGSYHYLPFNLTSSASSFSSSSPLSVSSLLSSSKLLQPVTSHSDHVNNESLIQLLLSPSHYDDEASIVICCNQIPDCSSLIGYSKTSNISHGEIGIVKHNPITDEYLILHRWTYNPTVTLWSLEEASTIPIPYFLAYYSLIFTGRLRESETVLIVNGHSAISYALLTICLSFGCTIYLTVETEEQKVNLLNHFPALDGGGGDHFLITTYYDEIEQTIKILTNGCGCDLVVNTMANNNDSNNSNNKLQPKTTTGNNKPTSQVKGDLTSLLQCLSIGGRCIDLNKSPMSVDDDLGLSIFLQNITYYSVTPEILFQSSITTSIPGDISHNHHRHPNIVDLMAKDINKGIICPLVNVVDSAEINKIDSKKRPVYLKQSTAQSNNNLPPVTLIIGQPGDIELEIIEKSRRYDKVDKFILISVRSSSEEELSSSRITTPIDFSDSSSSQVTPYYSYPLSSTHSFISSTSPTNSPLSPSLSSTFLSNNPSPLDYHACIINQLELLGCSLVNIDTAGNSINSRDTIKYQQVLKDISKSYSINKVFLVYRPETSHSGISNQQTNYHQHLHRHHHHQHLPANQLMIELLDYITNSNEISINFLTLISCSLTQDCTFIWPQLVRKCQQYGKRSGVNSITINLSDLLSSDDPNYWSQLDQYISQLYCQLIGTNDMDFKDNYHSNNLKPDGVYKLTCKVVNQYN